jgi:hypothetical protein
VQSNAEKSMKLLEVMVNSQSQAKPAQPTVSAATTLVAQNPVTTASPTADGSSVASSSTEGGSSMGTSTIGGESSAPAASTATVTSIVADITGGHKNDSNTLNGKSKDVSTLMLEEIKKIQKNTEGHKRINGVGNTWFR